MRKYQAANEKKLCRIICNQCGKEIEVKDGISREEVFHAEVRWGYFSEKDGQIHSFDLCEACYDKWTGGFLIPAEKKEETEFL